MSFTSMKTQGDADATIIAYEKLRIGKNEIIKRNARFKAESIYIGDFFYSDDNTIPRVLSSVAFGFSFPFLPSTYAL
jgi:hypothetical protein